jgi:hypothetical protein
LGKSAAQKTRPPAEYDAHAALPCPDIKIGLRHPVGGLLPGPSMVTVIWFTIGEIKIGRLLETAGRLTDAGGARIRAVPSLHHLMLSEIVVMIEMAGLQIGAGGGDFGDGGLGQNLGGDIVDRGICDFVNETDVSVFAGRHPRDNFPPGDFRIDDGLAPASPIVDHYNKILHGGLRRATQKGPADAAIISDNRK